MVRLRAIDLTEGSVAEIAIEVRGLRAPELISAA